MFKIYTEDEAFKILVKERKIKRIAKKEPDYPMSVPLFKKYELKYLKPGLLKCIKSGRITIGNTINDIYFLILG